MPHLHTFLHPGVNRYANVAFTNFAQIYSSVCTNLLQIHFFVQIVTMRTLKPGPLKDDCPITAISQKKNP